ncbi:MAG: response regulator [Thermodesulfobacteriota bacterium]
MYVDWHMLEKTDPFEESKMQASGEWRIVLIDDEPDLREVLSLTLQDAGYQVWAASDGRSGVGLCREKSPQIVLTDIRMPGMNGLEVLEAVKGLNPDTEVVVITAFGDLELATKALRLDASDFVTKPVGDEALELALLRARERYTRRRQLQEYTALLEWRQAATVQELRRSLEYEHNLIESSMDGILGVDADDAVVTYNAAMVRLLGYPKAEVIAKMYLDRFFEPGGLDRFREDLAGPKYGGPDRLFLYETALVDQAGRKVPVQVSALMMTDREDSGELVCFIRDLREIRRLEREMADQARILHQDKMMSLGRLAASVVHEINNPLSGILNYVRLIRRILGQGGPSPQQKEKFAGYIELVESETDRVSRIVSSLLTFSRMSPPAMVEVKVEELVDRSVLLCRHKLELAGIGLEIKAGPGLPAARGDFNQLQQCLINLIFNAVDAMPQGGRLEIASGYDPSRGLVWIRITDNGVGIPPEDLGRIFEPFYTTKSEGYGVGLGLSTVYGIMERHGGTVRVESRLGAGSSFILEWPA